MSSGNASKSCLTMGAVVLLFFFTACASIAPNPNGPDRAAAMEAAVPEIKIVSTEFKLEPSTIRVNAGQPVRLILDNTQASTEHGLFIPALGTRLFARAGELASNTFTFDTPGEYEIVCDLPGHTEAGMRGKLIVISTGLQKGEQ